MKKIIIAIVLILGLGGYAYWSSTKSSATPVTTTTDTSNPTSAPSETTNPAAAGSNTTSSGSTGSTATGAYKDGTYTGQLSDAFYGNLQVSATISGGKLTDVTFLTAPNTPQESIDVNSKAEPLLKSEAIAAQSAQVDIISGATQSSQAFQQSLGTALKQAQS